jgi:holo-[acyl-carrier protein] synthase
MIIGIGADCCDIERVTGAIERHGENFLTRVFTEDELSIGADRPEPNAYFARRFAGKEACAKALRSGITEQVGWRDIEILNGPDGQPVLRLKGAALELANSSVPEGYELIPHISLADDPPTSLAFVILEARPSRALG